MQFSVHRLGAVALLVISGVVLGTLITVNASPCETQRTVEEMQAPPVVVEVIDIAGCGNCHKIPGVPNTFGGVGPNLRDLGLAANDRRPGYSAQQYIRESIIDPEAFLAPKVDGGSYPGGVMLSAFDSALTDNEVELLVDYLASLGVGPIDQPPADDTKPSPLRTNRPPETLLPRAVFTGTEPNSAQVALGKYLFFDRRLSGNNSLSCASCHRPKFGFTDGRPLSAGYPSTKLFRNTPSLLNVGAQETLYWDGRIEGGDLTSVIRDHLIEAHFMSIDGRLMVERIKQVVGYPELYQEAFGQEPTFGRSLDALGAYVRSLWSQPSPYDRYQAGATDAINEAEVAGLALFQGKAGCNRCHNGPLFSDGQFHDLGLESDPTDFLDEDPERYITFRRFFRILGLPDYRTLREDPGRAAVTLKKSDRRRFRTPGLRALNLTAPYMHDGRFDTLEDVVQFYNAGAGPHQTAGLEPLGLTGSEVDQLVAFLRTLSGPTIGVESPRSPPYAVRPPPSVERANRDQTDGDDGDPLLISDQVVSQLDTGQKPITPLSPVPEPADNPTTPEKVALGRLLYFDRRMSGDGSVSCNTCHSSSTGFAATSRISMGGTGTSHWRNSMSLLNAGYYTRYNWEGAATSIEAQNAGAWSGAVAGNLDSALAEERLAQVPEYRQRFREAFGAPYPTWGNALKALASYQRTLNSRNVPFDMFLEGDTTALSESATRGYDLFQGKAGCIQCHHGPLLSDLSHHALGVPRNEELVTSPLRQITFRYEQAIKGVPRPVYDQATADYGLYYLTKRLEDRGSFKTPTLREISRTAPYMHNGVFERLEEVVEFYDRGGGEHRNKDPRLRPLELSDQEKRDLIAFLESLSGDPIVEPVLDSPPYGTYIPYTGNSVEAFP